MSLLKDKPTNKEKLRVVVVGGGLAGCLQALYLAQRGYHIDIYEKRKDMRKRQKEGGRSLNLGVSYRGIQALKEVGLDTLVLDHAVPLTSRMIHTRGGKCSVLPTGKKGQYIYSMERNKMNGILLDQVEKIPNVKLHFEHQLIGANLKEKSLTFQVASQSSSYGQQDHVKELQVQADFVFGCDGAHSCLRQHMIQLGRMDYHQMYIDVGYKELTIPPINGDFALSEKSLHIWPRGEFMMLAMPNQKRSFTLNLFVPFKLLESIRNKEDLLEFFKKHFSDCIGLVGEEHLVKEFFGTPTGSMITVKCKPHFVAENFLILGDAAHAMVPFSGQGLNCALEDCLIFKEYLIKANDDLRLAAQRYSDARWKDCNAIADLSIHNYLEMRSHTAKRTYIIYKYIDFALHFLFPKKFIPLIAMVGFSRIPYSEIVARNEWQKKVIGRGVFLVKIGIGAGVLLGLYKCVGICSPLQSRILQYVT